MFPPICARSSPPLISDILSHYIMLEHTQRVTAPLGKLGDLKEETIVESFRISSEPGP